jgi:hypothetical protein
VAAAHHDRVTGRPLDALESLNRIVAQTQDRLKYEGRLGDRRRKRKMLNQLREQLAHAHNARAWALHALSLKSSVLRDTGADFRAVPRLVGEIKDTASRDKALIERAEWLEIEAKSLRGDGYYIAQNWPGGARLAAEVVATIGDDTDFHLPTLHRSIRGLMLCYAYQGRRDDDTMKRCLRLLDDGVIATFPERATLWESIGRVNVLFGEFDAATTYFDTGEEECVESERQGVAIPSHLFQIVRGRLIALTHIPEHE